MKSINGANTSTIVVFLTIALLSCVVHAKTMDMEKGLRERGPQTPGRELKASSKISSLAKRHTSFLIANELNIHYAEGAESANPKHPCYAKNVQTRPMKASRPLQLA